ncbi:MAG: NAD(P)-dependent alcohol dehydrogenase [Aeromicrobium sp.]|uniref:NAD(P)-dependent alcohol dehydrogenase n=1 Tax=Aeromicrobium sp. TaxID=1871063 RepID=UPI0039E4A515
MTSTPRDRAIVQDAYGGPETWRLADVERRDPGRGQARVRVDAAAVDHGTWHLMTGTPLMARPAFGVRRPRVPTPGRDLTGVVEAVGPDVTDLAVGDTVVGMTAGTLAETVVADTTRLVRAPERLSPTQRAALPISGLTAIQAVEAARVEAGQRVLVIGASGGVGHYLVQLAAHRGAEVTAVCSASKAEAVRSWGAAHVLDRRSEDPADLPHRFDAVFDLAGGRTLRQRRRLATPRGTIVFIGDNTGGRVTGGYFRPMGHALVMLASRQRYVMLASRESGDILRRLVALVDEGTVTPHVHASYPLAEAADAMRLLESGEVVGKVAITMRREV